MQVVGLPNYVGRIKPIYRVRVRTQIYNQSMVQGREISLPLLTHSLPVTSNPSFAFTYIVMDLFSIYHASN